MDKDLQPMKDRFVRLRMTYLRGVNLKLFAYDYDQTWMGFFLDADLRIYSRYGSRDAASADSHNCVAGLLAAMNQVLELHKAAMAKPAEPAPPLDVLRPDDLPAMKQLGYAGSCVRCHMVNEAYIAQLRKDGEFKRGSMWLYPPPENVGLTLDPKDSNRVSAVLADSFAAKAGLQAGDRLRRAAGTTIVSINDFQHVLNGLAMPAKLSVEVERDGQPVTATLELEGEWKRWDVSWRKSVRMVGYRERFAHVVRASAAATKEKLQIPKDHLALRVVSAMDELTQAGLAVDDIIIAFDGKRSVPYRSPEFYPLLEHARGDKMEVTFLRDGKEMKATVTVP
jgi:hypothetical protein